MQHTVPYDMSHFPISPLDIEFLLTGLSGLADGDERLDIADDGHPDIDDDEQPATVLVARKRTQ
jgi:hypothetical protein